MSQQRLNISSFAKIICLLYIYLIYREINNDKKKEYFTSYLTRLKCELSVNVVKVSVSGSSIVLLALENVSRSEV